MAPFRICGRSLPFAPDDIWMFMWMFVPLHINDAIFDHKHLLHPVLLHGDRTSQHMPWGGDCNRTLIPGVADAQILDWDLHLCLALVPLEALICCFSAYGVIVRARKFERLLAACLCIWLLLAAATWLLYFVMVAPDAVELVTDAFTNMPGTVGGITSTLFSWRFLSTNWMAMLAWFFVALRLCLYLSLVGLVVYLALPEWVRESFTEGVAVFALRAIGVHNLMIESIMNLLAQQILSEVSFEEVSITDLVYGLLLVMARQMQGVLHAVAESDDVVDALRKSTDDAELLLQTGCDTGAGLSRSKRRACQVEGKCRALTPLDPSNKTDQEVLHELHHLAPFASGIYGPTMFGMPLAGSCFQPGTWVPSGCCRYLCDSMPCWHELPKGASCSDALRRRCCCCSCLLCCMCCRSAVSERDFPWGGSEDHLRHTLKVAAKRGRTAEPELCWASWQNYGHDQASPMGVLLDHEYRQIVITIRGSADITDCVSDIGVIPTFFDPLNLAGPSHRRFPPFDTTEDFFVPTVWLGIAEDHVRMLRGKRILESLLDPSCNNCRTTGYAVVVTGHSLGAGVACLVALILRGRLPEDVRVHYVGFEPPGCVLSMRLARETQRLNWVSGVTAYDFVPRLSVQNSKRVFNRAMEELEQCTRSKFQICLLFAGGMVKQYNLCLAYRLSKLVAGVFQALGGGPLYDAKDTGCCSYRRVEPVQLPRSKCQFPEMYAPGAIVYMKPVKEERVCIGMEKDSEWEAEWADPEDFQNDRSEFILSTRVLSYHVPWIYEQAIGSVHERFRSAAGAPRVEPFCARGEGSLRPMNEP